METATTPNGVFGAKLMWGYFGDFVSLLRNIPAYRDLPLTELLPAVFPDLTFVRVVRANKVRQAVSLWKAVQTATWRQEDGGRAAARQARTRPTRAFCTTTGRSFASTMERSSTCCARSCSRRPIGMRSSSTPGSSRCWSSMRTSPPTTRPRPSTCSTRLGIEAPDGLELEPRMRKQSDGINDDWARRYADLKLGTQFDLVPSVPEAA